jgi:hypothetical protein
MLRDWFWQLQTTGQGPDWFLFATFAPATTDRLLTVVRQHPLPGFASYHVSNGPCSRHHHDSTYELYIDQRNYEQVVQSFNGRPSQNIWIYHTIAVCGNDLTLERGYGGYPGMHGATETSLIVMLAAAPELTLVDWSVAYGGDGYSSGQLASGTSAPELLAYLREP